MKNLKLFLLLVIFSSFCFNNETDQNIIIQRSIDLEDITPYFHNRKPLIILDNGILKPTNNLEKFNEPVIFLNIEEIRKKDIKGFIEFTKFELKKDKATVSFKYDIEGLFATIYFKKTGEEWNVISKSLIEH